MVPHETPCLFVKADTGRLQPHDYIASDFFSATPTLMIEVEEEIISTIEEIDNTFSSINRALRSIRESVERIGKDNRKIAKDLGPWMRFFSEEHRGDLEDNAPCRGSSQRAPEDHGLQDIYVTGESPVSMKFSSPGNPFVDTSSEMVNRTFLGDLSARFHASHGGSMSSSSVPMVEERAFAAYGEDESSDDILPFNPSVLPPVFQGEEGLFATYKLISQGTGVRLEEICRRLPMVPREKISIFIDLLLRKRFIGKRGDVFRTA